MNCKNPRCVQGCPVNINIPGFIAELKEVIEICKEVEVEGKEISIAVPDELLSYVRQYSATVFMPYGRDTIMGLNPGISYLQVLLNEEVINTPEMVHELRDSWTPYLIVRSDAKFTESLAEYGLVYVTSFDNYDMYLDSDTNIGLDYLNPNGEN